MNRIFCRLNDLQVVLLIGLFAVATQVSAQYNTTDFYLTWGHVNQIGFAFVGRPDQIQSQCLDWMQANGIARSAQVDIRDQDSQIGITPAPFICHQIVRDGLHLAPIQPQTAINVAIQNRFYAYAGTQAAIVQRCLADIALDEIANATQFVELSVDPTPPLVFQTSEHQFRHVLRSAAICGAVAEKAQRIDIPFEQRYVGAFIQNQSFIGSGFPSAFTDQCRSFVRNAQLAPASTIQIGDNIVDLPDSLRGQWVCPALFALAEIEAVTSKRYEIGGIAGTNSFFFIGSRLGMMGQCANWLAAAPLGLYTSLTIGDKVVDMEHPVIGGPTCHKIIQAAQLITAKSLTIRYVSGVVQNLGFTFAGTPDAVLARCNELVRVNSIAPLNHMRIFGQDLAFESTLRAAAICQEISHRAVTVRPTETGWRWTVGGLINRQPFFFQGYFHEVVSQCDTFFATSSMRRLPVSTLRLLENVNDGVEGDLEDFALARSTTGAETCHEIIRHAKIVKTEQLGVVAGKIDFYGFSFVASLSTFDIMCSIYVRNNGISQASRLRIFKQYLPFQPPLLGPTAICQAIRDRSQIIVADRPPLSVSGTIAQTPFLFGPANLADINSACATFVNQLGVDGIEDLVVEGQRITPPADSWLGPEVCGALIQHLINPAG